jgi:uncharacterized OB-fold protein
VSDVAPLLPVTDDLDTGGFFEAAARGDLAIRRCNGCDAVLHVPRAYCRRCGSWEGRWWPVAPTGTAYSWCVVEHAVHPAFPAPYTVVLVDLDDLPGTRLIGHLPGTPALEPFSRLVAEMQVVDGAAFPRWRLAEV